MEAASQPDVESLRLDALRGLRVLDTEPESAFDDITSLAAELFQTPIALVSLLDDTRQWFKSHHGLALRETPIAISFCIHAIGAHGAVFEVPDARLDPRFAANPMVTGEPRIRFYAGAPLITADGHALGTLNVIDTKPRALSPRQREWLRVLARQVLAQLELRRRALELADAAARSAHAERGLRDDHALLAKTLQEQRSFVEQVAFLMPSVLYVYDLKERRNVYVNREVSAGLGYDLDELSPNDDPVTALMHADDLAQFPEHLARLQRADGQTVVDWTYRMRRKDGQWRWFHSRDAVMQRNDDGSPARVVGCATDITVIKQYEQMLRASEEQFRALAESAAVGVGAADLNGLVTYVNPRAAQMIGLPPAQCAGDGWLQRLHRDDEPAVRAQWHAAVAARAPYHGQFRLCPTPAQAVHVVCDARPVPVLVGGDPGYVVTIVDTTALRDSERHQQEREKAEYANRAKSDFLSRMSHELRTPLNAILGFTQLMALDPDPGNAPKQAERLAHIRTAGQQLLALVDEVLDLATIEAGRVDVTPQSMPLAPVVRRAIDIARPLAEHAGISIGCDDRALDAAPPLYADPKRVGQILLNLLSNAVKYNRRGGHVTLGVTCGNDVVGVTVADDGPGIADAALARLFEPFHRLDATKSTVPGTGLGLAIAQRLAGLMHGRIRVDSRLGVGSVFTIELPRADDDEGSPPDATPA